MIGVTPTNTAQIQLTAVTSHLSGCYPVLAHRTLGVHNTPKRLLAPLESAGDPRRVGQRVSDLAVADVGCLAEQMQDHPARSVVGFVDGADHELRNLDRADALLGVIRAGRVQHVIVYHPDRLMRQPRDLEELLTLSDEHDITLHGQANRRDLSNPADRFFLRIEVAHSCRSSDDTSRGLRDALEDRARAGRPYASARRAYGYAPGRMVIVEEAQIVREIFARYLDGDSPPQIAAELNERGIVTAQGRRWLWNPCTR